MAAGGRPRHLRGITGASDQTARLEKRKPKRDSSCGKIAAGRACPRPRCRTGDQADPSLPPHGGFLETGVERRVSGCPRNQQNKTNSACRAPDCPCAAARASAGRSLAPLQPAQGTVQWEPRPAVKFSVCFFCPFILYNTIGGSCIRERFLKENILVSGVYFLTHTNRAWRRLGFYLRVAFAGPCVQPARVSLAPFGVLRIFTRRPAKAFCSSRGGFYFQFCKSWRDFPRSGKRGFWVVLLSSLLTYAQLRFAGFG